MHVEMDDHQQDREHARAIISLLTSRLPGVRVAGCLTFWEDFVPLAALVAEGLNLRHAVSYRGAMNAKSKALTHGVLGRSGQEPPDHLPPCFYASPMVKVEGVHDVEQAEEGGDLCPGSKELVEQTCTVSDTAFEHFHF